MNAHSYLAVRIIRGLVILGDACLLLVWTFAALGFLGQNLFIVAWIGIFVLFAASVIRGIR